MAAQFSQTTRSLRRDSSSLVIATWAIAAVVFGLWLSWFTLGHVTVYEVSQQARLESQQSSPQVYALSAGKVISSTLTVGGQVQQGDVLVEIDPSNGQFRLEEEQNRLRSLPQQIASLQREIESRQRERASDLSSTVAATEAATFRQREAAVAADFANEYEQKLRQLSAAGLIASVEVTRAAADAKKLTAAGESLSSDLRRLQLEAQAHVSQHDATIEGLRHTLASLQGELGTSHAAVARLNGDLEKLVVRAPVSGRLGNVTPLQPGAYVTEGQPLATVVPLGALILVADFEPAKALGRIREGQHARLRLDGFPWAQYGSLSATVSRVSSEIREHLVRVEFALDANIASSAPLEHGLPGTVEVNIEETSPATLVLRSAGLLLSGTPSHGTVLAESSR